MSTKALSTVSTPGALLLKVILGKFDALRYLPKLPNGFLRFNPSGDLVADNYGFVSKAAAYTALAGDKLAVDTSGAAVTVTLPAAPLAGDVVEILDSTASFATNNLTLGRNGNKIDSASANLVVSTKDSRVTLIYINSTIGWKTRVSSGASTQFRLPGIMVESVDAFAGAGAIPVTTGVTKLTTTGAGQAITLADGVEGQIKRIMHVVDGGSAVLTPATKTGFTTITFTNVGESATLQFFTTRGWMAVSLFGAVAA